MLIATCPLKIGENRMERQPLDGSMLACCAYRGDVRDFMAHQAPPHWHHEWELLILDRGEAEAVLAGAPLRLHAGQGYFVNADKLHSLTCTPEEPCLYRSIVFDPAIVSGAVGSAFDIKYMRPLLERGPAYRLLDHTEDRLGELFRAFGTAYAACEAEGYGYEFTVRHALSQIMLCLAQRGGRPAADRLATAREKRLKQMVQWCDENYGQPFALDTLAKAIHCSPRECERVFKELLHISPKAYLLRRRMTAAMELLAQDDLPVIEVAVRCGFDNHSYFAKRFRALTGYMPSEYRRLCRVKAQKNI